MNWISYSRWIVADPQEIIIVFFLINMEDEEELLIPEAHKHKIVRLSTLKTNEPEYYDVEKAMILTFQRKLVHNPFYMLGIVVLVLLFIIGLLH